jgi:putative transposase
MARLARVVAVGEPHHLTQRGNNRQATFFDDHDRRAYCRLLATHGARHGIRVLGYCLMTNHVHLVAVPEQADSFARGLGRAHYHYTRALHERWGGNGHLWQNRFFSCPLDREHLWTALRYVDLNAVRAGLVEDALEYEWSSARGHVEGRDPLGLLDRELWEEACGREDWREVLGWTRDEEAAEAAALRRATRTGRPLGSARFVKRLEAVFGRKLDGKRTGRPKKKARATAAAKK